MKVATTRAELHKIQYKSIQVVAEGIGLENYLISNVAASRNFLCNVCLRKIKTLCRHALFEFLSGRRSARRPQFIIKVSSWRFYNRQEEVLDQKSPKVIDRFVFNYLTVDNAGQTADNKHTGSMIFRFFAWQVKPTSRWGIILFRTSQ